MKCEDIRKILFAYIDGDISDKENNNIEEHLKTCAECRAALEEQRVTGEKLLLLRRTPAMPEMARETLLTNRKRKTHPLLRPVIIAAPVVIILAVFLALQFGNLFGNPASIVARAYAATDGLTSFRYQHDEIQKGESLTDTAYTFHALTEYTAQDRFHVTAVIEIDIPGIDPANSEYLVELIGIGETGYVNTQNSNLYFTPDKDWLANMIPSKEESLDVMNLLGEIRTLDDETVDGVLCYHYSGSVDMDKYREWRTPHLEKSYYRLKNDGLITVTIDTFIKEQLDNVGDEIYLELWIGKSDYIVRKEIEKLSDGSVCEVRFYDCNEEIIIDPPVTGTGELLEGWSSFEIEPLVIPEK